MNQPSPQEIILIGAGGHGLVIADIVEAMGHRMIAFVDQYKAGSQHRGYPVNSFDKESLSDLTKRYIISIGSNAARKNISEAFPLPYTVAIHPRSTLSPSAAIAQGTVVMAGVCVNAAAHIGAHCILNTGCVVEHECILEDFVHVSPRAALAGNVRVGEGTHIGIGAVVLPGITIGKWCTIGAGAVVISNVPDGTTVIGVPARPIVK